MNMTVLYVMMLRLLQLQQNQKTLCFVVINCLCSSQLAEKSSLQKTHPYHHSIL